VPKLGSNPGVFSFIPRGNLLGISWLQGSVSAWFWVLRCYKGTVDTMHALLLITLLGCWFPVSAALGAGQEIVTNRPALVEARRPQTQAELRRWLENMIWEHGFSVEEVRAATGLNVAEIVTAQTTYHIFPTNRPERAKGEQLLVLPYPGGRHPRIGFLEGAQNPQRETKVSVFCPWDDRSYVVVDVPEAIFSDIGLLYLAHTHVPTIWEQQGIELPKLEWQQGSNGVLSCHRVLPNKVEFGTTVTPLKEGVAMELWLKNGTGKTLKGLRVQNCVMLKGAAGFAEQTRENKVHSGNYVATRSASGNRWVITAWDPLNRTWDNPPVPCMHSDPQIPDCPAGETRRARGWLSFYEGTNVQAEFERIEAKGWKKHGVGR
jgi:hypothetical protein